jgi:hypothetical protein
MYESACELRRISFFELGIWIAQSMPGPIGIETIGSQNDIMQTFTKLILPVEIRLLGLLF